MALQNNERYRSTVHTAWKGRADGSRLHHHIKCLDLSGTIICQRNAVGILGFVSDEGIKRNHGRPGAAQGPAALRAALANIPLNESHNPIFDCGDIVCNDGDLEAAQSLLGDAVAMMISNGILPIVLGGGHEVAWGNYQGIMKALPDCDCGAVNIDAHFDIRPLENGSQGTSGTSFHQIYEHRKGAGLTFDYSCIGIQSAGNTQQLFAAADAMGVKYVLAESFFLQGIGEGLALAKAAAAKHSSIYLTVCLDVFAAPFAPGVSAPQPLGLLPWHVIPIIKFLVSTGKLVSIDIAELSPPHDIDGITAKLAAALIAHLL